MILRALSAHTLVYHHAPSLPSMQADLGRFLTMVNGQAPGAPFLSSVDVPEATGPVDGKVEKR
ncbi:MAG: hypothetical protein ACYCW6_21680 [Candidatus Xenobia bacterium]